MWSQKRIRYAGVAAIIGGIIGVAVTPLMVMVKYSTGWSIIPKPAWEGIVRPALGPLVSFASPVVLWVFYGAIYTVALLLMLAGVLALRAKEADRTDRVKTVALWVILIGLCLIIPGDAVHTATWHLGGHTLPKPGLNVVASTGFAIAMLGQNLVLGGSFVLGVAALRRRFLPSWLAYLLVAVAPGGVILTLTLLPTTPSGALWMFSVLMTAVGYSLASHTFQHQLAA